MCAAFSACVVILPFRPLLHCSHICPRIEAIDHSCANSSGATHARTHMRYRYIRPSPCSHSSFHIAFFVSQCGRGFNSSRDTARHSATHTGVKSHVCTICFARFTRAGALTVHARSHDQSTKYFECTHAGCAKSFTQKSVLIAHERTHTGEKPFQCEICLKAFAQRTALGQKQQAENKKRENVGRMEGVRCSYAHACAFAHLSPLISLLTCLSDPPTNALGRSAIRRMYTNRNTRAFVLSCVRRSVCLIASCVVVCVCVCASRCDQCPLCPLRFHTSSNLSSHHRTHTGAYRFACTLCEKRFTRRAALVRHQVWHEAPILPEEEVEKVRKERGMLPLLQISAASYAAAAAAAAAIQLYSTRGLSSHSASDPTDALLPDGADEEDGYVDPTGGVDADADGDGDGDLDVAVHGDGDSLHLDPSDGSSMRLPIGLFEDESDQQPDQHMHQHQQHHHHAPP